MQARLRAPAANRVVTLERSGKTFILIGLADHAAANLEHADRLIAEINPDSVCVELCETRFRILTDDGYWENLKIIDAFKQGKGLVLLAGLAGSVFLNRQGHSLAVRLGREMMGRLDQVEALGGKVYFGERDLQITLKRSWRSLPHSKKAKLLLRLFRELFPWGKPNPETSQLPYNLQHYLFSALTGYLPEIKAPLVEETDQYLWSSIERAEGAVVVAIVNGERLDSLSQCADRPVDREQLASHPVSEKRSRWQTLGFALLMIAVVAWSIWRLDEVPLENMLLAWVLPNSLLTGFFVLVGGGKPLSILAGMLVSPFTPLSLAIRSGIVVGMVEGWLRKPVVADCERIPQDIRAIRTIYGNRLTRVLLVAFLAHVGSSLGNYVGFFLLIRLLY